MATEYVPYSGPIVTRAEAKARGLTRYFTGKLCPHGHVSERWVASYSCDACQLLDAGKRYSENINGRRNKKLGWYQENIERGRERARMFSKATYEARKPYYKAWLAANRDHINAYHRERFAKASDVERESYRVNVRVRRARRRGNGGKHTAAQIRQMLGNQRHKCANCLVSLNRGYHVDHIVPISRGGSNSIENIQLLCQPCNQRKFTKDQFAWAQEQGRLL